MPQILTPSKIGAHVPAGRRSFVFRLRADISFAKYNSPALRNRVKFPYGRNMSSS